MYMSGDLGSQYSCVDESRNGGVSGNVRRSRVASHHRPAWASTMSNLGKEQASISNDRRIVCTKAVKFIGTQGNQPNRSVFLTE